MNERQQAWDIANRWLNLGDQFGRVDPDGDECVVARSYLRALEKIERLTEILERSGARGSRTVAELADKWPKGIQP